MDPVFKKGIREEEWAYIHPKLKAIYARIQDLAKARQNLVEITSMIRPHTTDSGVHATGRALDCVPRRQSNRYCEFDLCRSIVEAVNKEFPRKDKFSTALWHDVGLGFHIHLQVPQDPLWKDLLGLIPKESEIADPK